jgi:hypothetical protein
MLNRNILLLYLKSIHTDTDVESGVCIGKYASPSPTSVDLIWGRKKESGEEGGNVKEQGKEERKKKKLKLKGLNKCKRGGKKSKGVQKE